MIKSALFAFINWASGRTAFERRARHIALDYAQALAIDPTLQLDLADTMKAADRYLGFLTGETIEVTGEPA